MKIIAQKSDKNVYADVHDCDDDNDGDESAQYI